MKMVFRRDLLNWGREIYLMGLDPILHLHHIDGMTKTQIQLPDRLYRDVKQLAKKQEWSLAEVLRRGAEHMLRTYDASPTKAAAWKLPEPLDLGGPPRVPPSRWRELANDPVLRR